MKMESTNEDWHQYKKILSKIIFTDFKYQLLSIETDLLQFYRKIIEKNIRELNQTKIL